MPTSGFLFDQQRRRQEARQNHFDRRMTEMIAETNNAPAATPAPQKAKPMGNKLIDIKGLNTKAIADVGAKMAGIRDLVARVHDSGNKLHAELTDVHEQLEQARTDLRFHAESMGNSGSNGDISDDEKEREDEQEHRIVAPEGLAEDTSAEPGYVHRTALPAISPGLDAAIQDELDHSPSAIATE
jgi:hypothetical protein